MSPGLAISTPALAAAAERGVKLSGDIDPVSYTHLDVYKRQLPGGADAPGMRPQARSARAACAVTEFAS